MLMQEAYVLRAECEPEKHVTSSHSPGTIVLRYRNGSIYTTTSRHLAVKFNMTD